MRPSAPGQCSPATIGWAALPLLLGGCQFIPGTETASIHEAERAVATQLSDPESAQFRNERVEKGPNGAIVCGEVNSRNRLGGYAGFSRFGYVERTKAVSVIPVDSSPSSDAAIASFPKACLPDMQGALDSLPAADRNETIENLMSRKP